MGELSDLLKKLQLSSDEDDFNSVHNHLQCLIDKIHQKDASLVCQEIVKEDVLVIAKKTLEKGKEENQSLAAELVAELAKIENCRISCVEASIVPLLVKKLSSGDNATALQACRALGNICYEYDGGRLCVIEAGGTEQLLYLLRRISELSDDRPEHHQLRLVATGFLLNLLNLYEATEDRPVDSQLLEVLCLYLDKYAADEDIPTHILLSLSCLADCDISRKLMISKDISPQLLKVLKSSKSPEVIETSLELITNLSETESVKAQFAASGICESVIDVVNGHVETPVNDLSTAIVKTATDLLVLILVGDESMNLLYGEGQGDVYKVMVEWLTSSVEHLRIASALAMGNFARNDKHCIDMVQSGIAEKMISVLSKNNSVEGDIRLQHALLSALRNLCIAQQNKPVIVKQKALDVLLPMVSSIQTYPVVFKLLATLRMLIDGQSEAACEIGLSEDAIKKIVSWSTTAEHPGVQGEASRILSWIVKNCDRNERVMNSLEKSGVICPLVDMLASEHTVMVNEASLALALLFTQINTDSLSNLLKETPFLNHVLMVLKKPHLPSEVAGTVLSTLFAASVSDEFIKSTETSAEFKNVLNTYSSHPNEQIKEVVIKLNQRLNSA